MDVKLYNLQSKVYEDYISDSKAKCEQYILNNGRVHKAKSVLTTVTNIDWEIINKVYDYDGLEVGDC